MIVKGILRQKILDTPDRYPLKNAERLSFKSADTKDVFENVFCFFWCGRDRIFFHEIISKLTRNHHKIFE